MKHAASYIYYFILSVIMPVYAFTPAETNTVARAILSYASMDNEDDIDADAEYPVSYTDLGGLLDCVSFSGWTRQDKGAALFEYLMTQSTNDFSKIDGDTRELIRIGLCEYRDLNFTNALPIVRNLSVNPSSTLRGDAIHIYYKWSSLDQNLYSVTQAILTNTVWATKNDKVDAWRGMSGVMNRHVISLGKDENHTNAVHAVYKTRAYNAECAIELDNMFVLEIPGYEFSSNRLDTVIGWLNNTNINSTLSSRLMPITNRLIQSSAELVTLQNLQ